MGAFTFKKSERLVGKKMVSDIFSHKNSVSVSPIKAFYNVANDNSEELMLRFGISVPKKKFKRAVDRNQIKRLVREALRTNKTFIEETLYQHKIELHVMIVCHFDQIPSYASVNSKIKATIERLAKRLNSDDKN